MPEFYFGIQHNPSPVLGQMIVLNAQARCTPPWVLGPANVATHAYVIWKEDDGSVYRLDADYPRSKVVKCNGLKFAGHYAHWQAFGDVEKAIARALEMENKPYDFFEAASQVLPFVDTQEWLKDCFICTHMSLDAFAKCGPEHSKLVHSLTDWVPESCGQAMRRNENTTWLKRAH